ncbi:HlyD family secretion protein [Chryseosolibacter indicus]|uniref:HlyD family secretion protein n=1 Tax=Chryseosolibacter indicus TaxID=2782351 RepID=A0ABS5VZE5_9BACT|nr:HlyD family secretion protein [Chryseosolibacter indicus]MBT1706222.1 HlyD family secretion protein [Chryseosolibacter indicus]
MEKEKKQKKNKVFATVLIVIVSVGLIFGVYKYIHGQNHEETDDAQVEANISPIIPKVSGYVTKVLVEDNQTVKAGDTLVVLDDRDLAIKVLQAESALETAKANVSSSGAGYETAQQTALSSSFNAQAAEGNIELARVRLRRAESDFKRYEELLKTNSITRQQYEQAEAERDAAAKQLEVAERQREALLRESSARRSQSTVSQRNISLAQTVVKEREADLAFAKLQLSYAYIISPANGVISRKNIQVGQLVQAGQSLFALVDERDKWVVANFKETQLEKMKAGQKVEISVDAFPDETFTGKIESISPATGAKFSLLPPDNASGNFVKVVQRVPVKIVLEKTVHNNSLRAGMNVMVDVHLN